MNRKLLVLVFALLVTTLAVVAARAPMSQIAAQPADLVITNAKVVTVDDAVPGAEAVAVRAGRILALGTSEEMKRHVGTSTEVIDAQGQLVIPGFIESHGHFNGVGDAQLNLQLMKTTSWDEILAMVADAVKTAKPGQWIIGRGWHQEKWTSRPEPNVEGFPTHASLDKVSPDNPVILTHASGHASFANGKALQLSGITRNTENPAGGDILKDPNGNPTGLMRERASGLIKVHAGEPPLTPDERVARARRVLELASKEVLSKGVTSFQDAGSSFATIDLMKKMVDEGKLDVRLWVMVREGNRAEAPKLKQYRTIDYGNGHLTVRAMKRSIDGALGSRGAWFLEEYADKPGWVGTETTTVKEIEESARLAMEHGYQLCVHAIGDRGNREALDIFERAFKANPAKKDLRWRIEHAQHLHPADISRFGKLAVIPAMQGVHCTSDAPYVIERLGAKRAEEGAYVWQKLMKTGAVISNGTDAPVEDVDPIASYYASVSRKLKDGSVFYPDQRMSRMEALKSYTINAAFAAFEENSKGSLKVGKYGDMVILSKDILTVPEDDIASAKIVYSIVGGKVAYKAAGLR